MANVNVDEARRNALILLLEFRTLAEATKQAYDDLVEGDARAAERVLVHYEERAEAAAHFLTDKVLGNLDFFEEDDG